MEGTLEPSIFLPLLSPSDGTTMPATSLLILVLENQTQGLTCAGSVLKLCPELLVCTPEVRVLFCADSASSDAKLLLG